MVRIFKKMANTIRSHLTKIKNSRANSLLVKGMFRINLVHICLVKSENSIL